MVTLQQFLVDARFVVVAFHPGIGDHADQVFVAGLVFGQQHQVIVMDLAADALRLAVQTAAGRHISLAADDGLETGALCHFVEIHRAEHDPVISDRHRGEFQFFDAFDQFIQTAGSIQQGELRMNMKMYKISNSHINNLNNKK